ncbi:hypothetical protein IDG98_01590 [Pelagibacterales bacterium SAG-MED17]|nr:hypothetical protein [Pelagibacterales bacterium SAG-MED17]
MNNFFLKYLAVFFILTLSACSYKPIFSESNYNFEINEIIFSGERYINRIIKNKLDLIKNEKDQNKKKYDLLIQTNKERLIVSKDSKGDPLKFDLVVTTNYEISYEKRLLFKKEVIKNNIYNNDVDKFKLEQNEKIILENLSEKISENIISSIINLDDN